MCNVKQQDDEAILDENLKSCSISIDRSKELIDKGKLSSHHSFNLLKCQKKVARF